MVVRWEGGKSRRLMRWEGVRVARWQGGKGGKVVRWQGWKGGRMVRQKSGRYLFFFKDGEHKMSPRFHLFVSDVNQENAGVGCVQDFLPGRRDAKTLLRSFASC